VSGDLPSLNLVFELDKTTVPDKYIISVQNVEKALMAINLNKAIGPDQIPNWCLRDFAEPLSRPICAIFNSSIREGVVPSVWKSADIIPIPKVIPPNSIESDLRPISLTPVLSKLLEGFVGTWLWEIVAPLIDSNQYGGLKGVSTTHALVDMVHNWLRAAEQHETVRVLLLDYSKAFDHVDHNILLQKLKSMGTPDILLRWLSSFLSDRQQRVRVNSDVSEWLSPNGSVPQGSYLGPLLFIVMIHDLSVDCLCHKFMDDTTFSESFKLPSDSKMQNYTNKMIEWSNTNNMIINGKKTKELIISYSTQKPDISLIQIGDTPIERVKQTKLLGVILSDDLSWQDNTNYIYSKAAKRLYFLTLLRRAGVSKGDLLIYYTSVIRSVVEYGCQVWHTSLTECQTKLLESIQKRAMQIILWDHSYKNSLEIMGLKTLAERRTELCKNFFNKIQKEDDKLNYLLPKSKEKIYSLRKQLKCPLPNLRTERFKNTFINYSLFNYQ
jgi:hypothetical protein